MVVDQITDSSQSGAKVLQFYRWVIFVEVWEAEHAKMRKNVWTALPDVLELKS